MTSFSYDPDTKLIEMNDETLDGRIFLRNLEGELREATKLPQITADFIAIEVTWTITSDGASWRLSEPSFPSYNVEVKYDKEKGYRVLRYPPTITKEDEDEKCREYAKNWIKRHARINNIKPDLPPIPGKVIGIEAEAHLDTQQNRYRAIAHDGGQLIVFYTNHDSMSYFMLKSISAVGFVLVQFKDKAEYDQHMTEVKSDCSAFEKLVGKEREIEVEMKTFIRKNDL